MTRTLQQQPLVFLPGIQSMMRKRKGRQKDDEPEIQKRKIIGRIGDID